MVVVNICDFCGRFFVFSLASDSAGDFFLNHFGANPNFLCYLYPIGSHGIGIFTYMNG